MEPHENQDEVIAFLSRSETYGVAGPVERVETHGAIVFLAGGYAYKLKRAVKYPYMDYSTPDKRRGMCERELQINRRTAPQIYLEVRSVVRDRNGALQFGARDAADALDTILVMRRFDQQTLFGRLCKAGTLTPELMRETAETIAAFHEAAEITHAFGGAEGIAAVVAEDNDMFASMQNAPFDAAAITDYARSSKAALAQVSDLLDRRRDQGRVRRCHGDLHLDNIFLFDGKPTLFDAIEFADDFAAIDVFYDLAFLIMDLEHHDARGLANVLLNRYLELTTDYEGIATLPLFLSCRAAIRAHVNAARAKALNPRNPQFSDATTYFRLAEYFLRDEPQRLIVIGGLSGTGKTTLARMLAPEIGRTPGAIILRSDVTRKRLMGVRDTMRLPQSAYAPDMNAKVFCEMAHRARTILASGHAVVMDAVYGTEEERRQIADVAVDTGASFDGLWLEAAPEILAGRIAARSGDASDATVEVLKKQLRAISAPQDWAKIDATGRPETIAKRIRTHLGLARQA